MKSQDVDWCEACIGKSVRNLGLCRLKELKEKQKEPILAFIDGDNVFVSLPTGYGKPIIYGIFPLH